MQLTRQTEYALLGLVALARGAGERSDTAAISKLTGVEPTFLKKIFQRLAQKKLLQSSRGKAGGFSLARPAKEISVAAVIDAVEGCVFTYACQDSSFRCAKREKSCRIRTLWAEAESAMRKVFEQTTIADLVK